MVLTGRQLEVSQLNDTTTNSRPLVILHEFGHMTHTELNLSTIAKALISPTVTSPKSERIPSQYPSGTP